MISESHIMFGDSSLQIISQPRKKKNMQILNPLKISRYMTTFLNKCPLYPSYGSGGQQKLYPHEAGMSDLPLTHRCQQQEDLGYLRDGLLCHEVGHHTQSLGTRGPHRCHHLHKHNQMHISHTTPNNTHTQIHSQVWTSIRFTI